MENLSIVLSIILTDAVVHIAVRISSSNVLSWSCSAYF